MTKFLFSRLAVFALIQFFLGIALSASGLAQDWKVRRPRGTLKVVELASQCAAAGTNSGEALVGLNKDNE